VETVLLYILGILIVFVGLVLSIGLHEVGHLLPAKLFGVRVQQYMIGFGPTIFSRKFGETEYGFKAIPLGGYISMSGMYPPARSGEGARTASTGFFQTLTEDARTASAQTVMVDEEHRTFYQLPVLKRVIIMLGGPVMNLLIAIVLYAVLLCGFGAAQTSTTIGSVSECITTLGSTQTECATDDPAAPGAEAGLLPGDRLVSMNGEAIESWAQGTEIIRESVGEPLTLIVERDGAEVTLEATPLLTERYVVDENGETLEDSQGDAMTEEVGFLGIGAASEIVQQPLTAVLPAVGENISAVTEMILHLPQRTDRGSGHRPPRRRDHQYRHHPGGGPHRDPRGNGRVPQRRPVCVQPRAADAARRRPRSGSAVGGHSAVLCQTFRSARSRSGRCGKSHPPHPRSRSSSGINDADPALRRHREPDQHPVTSLRFSRVHSKVPSADVEFLCACHQSGNAQSSRNPRPPS
jgi:membrane-associated protease RseP (regulator of RpoE activity)